MMGSSKGSSNRTRSTASRNVGGFSAKREPLQSLPDRINALPSAAGPTRRGVVRPKFTMGLGATAASTKGSTRSASTEKDTSEDTQRLEQELVVKARELAQLQVQLNEEIAQRRRYQEQLQLRDAELGDHRASINITAERDRLQKEFDAELVSMARKHEKAMNEIKYKHDTELRTTAKEHDTELRTAKTHAKERYAQLESQTSEQITQLQSEVQQAHRELKALRSFETQAGSDRVAWETDRVQLVAQVENLQRQVEEKDVQLTTASSDEHGLRAENAFLKTELREAESLRRKLHNEVQELRGNIRVFARVRPAVRNDAVQASKVGHEATLADFRYPGGREANQLEVVSAGESATGQATLNRHAFTFDRVFDTKSRQADVFAEVSNLIQSVLDGFNVSIFAYGQTGSGKTHTLEGPPDYYNLPSSASASGRPGELAHPDAGMIPRAVHLLWRLAEQLQTVGWNYTFEGQMLEIYLDGINDLLGSHAFDKTKHEIKHDSVTGRTTVTATVSVGLHSPAEVFALLEQAKRRRQVAATMMNERSSRSHSVFILRAQGINTLTGEKSDATLNLVDLAGSERLANSGSAANPQRLREAQSINKSLSSLADVIAALSAAQNGGKAPGHVPYRNSTLTWLLKNSLGGNSKTLMLLALSPMLAHQSESLCSLRFATKVNATHVGPAKRIRGGD